MKQFQKAAVAMLILTLVVLAMSLASAASAVWGN